MPDAPAISDEPKLTLKQLKAVGPDIVVVFSAGHELITASISGKPIEPNRLENYYSAWTNILREFGMDGVLIEFAIDEIDKRWPA